ncbi:DHH family phosphoesterase [Photobacterium leiognathi]|uniref:DHH family phosphoesterase n=1 Tax=Photobacterium leiognathi TaxID=553611 RepID=UPI002981A370|nr:DHH family phosphoesterase [Photobacterium leiognathi]
MKYQHYDVFNGDADGICALLQLRLNAPRRSILISGVKRDNQLLKKISPQQGDTVTCLDISMEKNTNELINILNIGCDVFYVDHHKSGDIPMSDKLDTIINTDANTCTSLLINEKLDNRYIEWAIVGAYGDNLINVANNLADSIGLNKEQKKQLNELGVLINYNGYGSMLSDLHFDPVILFKMLLNYQSPFEVLSSDTSPYLALKQGYLRDFKHVENIRPKIKEKNSACYVLPNETWSRRVVGVFSNTLANNDPCKAHIVALEIDKEHYQISLRSPLNKKYGASDICSQYPSGGGRSGAAGINSLHKSELVNLSKKVNDYYGVE